VGLQTYRKKRKFNVTSEPRGRVGQGGGHRYVIQKHDATRLHYDLRLELDGVMKSWAVTRGPSLDPNDKRLAVHVEDHPIEYNTFEGIIPEGEYGGGTVMVWDRGTWEPDGDPHKGLAKGHLEFTLHGKKLRGHWHLVRMRARQGDRHENWLLIKGKDEEARSGRDADILETEPLSAATGRSMEEIAGGKGRKRVWHSNRAKGAPADAPDAPKDPNAPKVLGRPQSQREFKAQLKALGTGRAKPERKAAPAKAAKEPAARRLAAKPRARAKSAVAKVERKSGQGPRQRAEARMPDFIPPSLATLAGGAPSSNNWLHEIKFDGYRIEARLDQRDVRLLTRKKLDWTHRFEPIAEAFKALPAETALIDGELVVEDDRGISNFSLLQSDLKDGRSDRFVYWAFDLLYLDGKDLTGESLTERKAALHRLLKGESRKGRIRYVEHVDGDGRAVFKSACEMNLEGIVSKLRDAPYRSGRTDNFVKVKCHDEQEFVVAGFSPSNVTPKAVGALTVAYHENGKLRYGGRVGTGYTHEVARDLWKRLEPLRADRPPVALPPDERRKNVIWVKPQVVIEAEFRGITHDGLLRQAAYKGLREDKPASEVVREMPAAANSATMAQRQPVRKSTRASDSAAQSAASPKSARTSKNQGGAEVADVRLTHPDRVYWPDAGITKQELAEYYVRVWDVMAPHVVGRVLAIVRCPEGVGGECFFQKHIASNVKQSALRHVVKGKDHDVIAVENVGELVELVQSGALEIHVRGSRLDSLETCDRIVFDLDPGEGVAWEDVVAGAKEIRDRLSELKLKSFAKLSGGKGIHVVLPIADIDWDAAKTFSGAIATAMATDSPKLYLAKMTKALREGKIFIDYFRNSREATSVAPYSTRARAGAAVSMPVSWEALSRTQSGHQFTLPDLKKLPGKDAWADLGKVRQKLAEIAKKKR
jgi:bifunctional non-homologous end joining protein LigD